MGDETLGKFRNEYEKLHQALQKTHESEKRLMQKCRELNAEIVANSAKVSTALKLSQDDQATISNLKKVTSAALQQLFIVHMHSAPVSIFARSLCNTLRVDPYPST